MTNDKFNYLLKLEKHFEEEQIKLPICGEKQIHPIRVLSNNTKDIFFIDIDHRSSITISKKKLQHRHSNSNTVLIRLEIDCKPHMYSDGSLSSRNHIHIFDEKRGSIVYDLEGEYGTLFTNLNDFTTVFIDFCKIFNIDTEHVLIQGVI